MVVESEDKACPPQRALIFCFPVLPMKRILLTAALLLVASAKLQATEAVIFDGGGYKIQILVGMTDKPVVGQLHFTSPGAKDWVVIPHDLLRIEKFDFGKILLMHFSNKQKNPELPDSFSLSIRKEKAVLSIKGETIRSTVQWDI